MSRTYPFDTRLFSSFPDAISAIEGYLDPLIGASSSSLDAITDQVGPLDNAKLHSAVAYTLDGLFFMYLRAKGIKLDDHPMKAELERVKKTIDKVVEVGKKVSQVSQEPSEKAGKASLKIDKAAATRFVKAVIGGGLTESKKNKKEVDEDERSSDNEDSSNSEEEGADSDENDGTSAGKKGGANSHVGDSTASSKEKPYLAREKSTLGKKNKNGNSKKSKRPKK